MPEADTRAKILIVDDSEIVLDLVAMYLEDHGFEVDTLDNAVGLPAAVESEPPDLILLDVFMPDLPVNEATLLIQGATRHHIPILLHSDMDEDELSRTTEKTGADGYVVKTMDADELVAQLKPWLPGGAKRLALETS